MMVLAAPTLLPADEGMWLFNRPPRKLLKAHYAFDATDDWLLHLQRSAVRFNSGGSGSFISPNGLVLTNHHVGADALQKLSNAEHDYVEQGFHARSQAEEIACLDLELNVLISIEDVTKAIKTAVTNIDDPVAAEKARRAAMNKIEQESLEKTGLRSDVVTLFHGGEYHLYRYKKYTDVRLVFAPEKQIAFFGGDPDNFEYPRYDLDVCFFRAYEDGKPAQVDHFLRWSAAGPALDELVFVAGHPGHTDRLNTVDHVEFLRDVVFPKSLEVLYRREVLLKTFSDRSQENARRAADDYFGIANTRKARVGGLAALQDPSIMKSKRQQEAALEAAVADSLRDKGSDDDNAWKKVAQAISVWRSIYTSKSLLEDHQAFNSELFEIARGVLRISAESAKPNADRLREYRESNLDSLRQWLYSSAPIYDDLEVLRLADSLGMYLSLSDPADPLVADVLAGKSPVDRATELVQGSKLGDVAVRKQWAEMKPAEQSAIDDPMLALARLVDPAARDFRRLYDTQVEEPLRQAYSTIANARLSVAQNRVNPHPEIYPDATFTLRLAFGTVRGYREQGQQIPAWTMIAGAYERAKSHDNHDPFALPPSWLKAEKSLDLTTPLNFVSTADIIGGNSGSPVVNRAGEFVGIIFDGNIQSLALDFVYTDEQARAVSVHSSGILAALDKVYHANELVAEIRAQQAQPGK